MKVDKLSVRTFYVVYPNQNLNAFSQKKQQTTSIDVFVHFCSHYQYIINEKIKMV